MLWTTNKAISTGMVSIRPWPSQLWPSKAKTSTINYWKRFLDKVRIITYRKVPKFLDTRKLCCNLPKTQTKLPNLSVFHQKDTNGIASSEDPDQTAPLGTV